MAISFTPTKIARFVGALYGVALNNSTYSAALQEIYARGFNAVANEVFVADFGTQTTAAVAATIATNLGLTGAAQTSAAAYLEGQLNAAAAADRGAVVINALNLFAGLSTDATYGAAATTFEGRVANAINYSLATSSVQHGAFADLAAGTVLNLVTGFDNLLGTSGDDAFAANSIGGVNTLGDGDLLNGGTGTDTLNADLINLGYVITPATTGIETINIRAQNNGADAAQNNTQGQGVTVDAERMSGVSTWSSTNSRADLIIEDVRINSNVSTIAFVQSDPGNVDLGVYFNERNLVNTVGSTSVLNIQLMDTGAAAVAATAATPLLNNPYDTFKFAANGQMITLALPNASAADTYAQLLAAFQAAIAANPALAGGVTATLGANFTVTDPLSGTQVTGQTITLTAGSSVAITTPTGSGWFNTTGASVPASSNMYTTYNNSSASQAALVSTNVILDDVGMGDTGGDLVIGGMSTGLTSNDKGVELFNIEVRDNSKLQTINSTNNTLREVYIENGATSSTSSAYVTTTTDAGDLTVNGTNFGTSVAISTVDAALRGTEAIAGSNQTISHSINGSAGFTDVRVIDASAMRGKFAFTAAITNDSLAKYVNAADTAANPGADIATNNTAGLGANFDYDGGINNDTMTVTIDANVASSRSTVVSGQSDFTFNVAGGTGNDAITLSVLGSGLAGGAQAWYNNQKLNANIAINAGDGNDTIRTPGAGDVIIDAGTGDDTVYTDNTGALTTANATGFAGPAAVAYTNAAAAELAAAQSAAVASNTTGFLHGDGTAIGASITTAAAVAALATLDQITPTNPPALPVITHAALAAGTAAAAAAGAITLAQKVALDAAYNSSTGGVVTPAVGIGAAATLVGQVAVAGNVTAPELAAGDALLATYVAAAKAAQATAAANDANTVTQNALLNATQLAVKNATMAMNGVEDPTTGGIELGTATKVANLATLHSALVSGTTQAAAVAAIDVATLNGTLTGGEPAALLAAVGAGAMDAMDAAAVTAILSVTKNTAALANAAAQATLTAALTADATAVSTAAAIVSADPADVGNNSAVANDAVGSTEAAAAAVAAAAAAAAAAVDLASSQAINTALTGLKSAVNVGSLDADVVNAIANANAAVLAAIATSAATGTGAVAVNPLGGGVPAALLLLAGVPGTPVDAAEELAFDTGALGVYDANSIDSLIIANSVQTDLLTLVAANTAATAAATATASTIAAAAAASGGNSLLVAAPKAVYVFDTTNQASTYNRVTADDRNLADLKSDANNSNNFFNSTVKVTYKGLDASVVVAGTGYKTSDLEINQAIKQAINTDAVLSKLLAAYDGPGNTLVVTSLIDGTMPTTVSSSALAGAAAAYGLAAGATEAQVLAAMTASKTAFDAKGDYATQFAESGAAAGNVTLTGANSVSSSDNTVTPGTGNDVIVLGTTVGTDLMTSSNEVVVYSGSFGADTIVNFAASGLGIDVLNFSALGGRGTTALNSLSADKSIVIQAQAATPLTTTQIAALFTDSATAISHVYVAYDSNNIGSVYMIADATGTTAGNVTATLVGTIDLADTGWATLTAANFA